MEDKKRILLELCHQIRHNGLISHEYFIDEQGLTAMNRNHTVLLFIPYYCGRDLPEPLMIQDIELDDGKFQKINTKYLYDFYRNLDKFKATMQRQGYIKCKNIHYLKSQLNNILLQCNGYESIFNLNYLNEAFLNFPVNVYMKLLHDDGILYVKYDFYNFRVYAAIACRVPEARTDKEYDVRWEI